MKGETALSSKKEVQLHKTQHFDLKTARLISALQIFLVLFPQTHREASDSPHLEETQSIRALSDLMTPKGKLQNRPERETERKQFRVHSECSELHYMGQASNRCPTCRILPFNAESPNKNTKNACRAEEAVTHWLCLSKKYLSNSGCI